MTTKNMIRPRITSELTSSTEREMEKKREALIIKGDIYIASREGLDSLTQRQIREITGGNMIAENVFGSNEEFCNRLGVAFKPDKEK